MANKSASSLQRRSQKRLVPKHPIAPEDSVALGRQHEHRLAVPPAERALRGEVEVHIAVAVRREDAEAVGFCDRRVRDHVRQLVDERVVAATAARGRVRRARRNERHFTELEVRAKPIHHRFHAQRPGTWPLSLSPWWKIMPVIGPRC